MDLLTQLSKTSTKPFEKIVREKAGMIAKEMEGNPSPKEKINKED